MKEFESRINLNIPLEELSMKVCEKYDLGNFISNKLIEIGYEDYNYFLTTSKGKFVVKIFSNFRTDKDAEYLTQRASVAFENGVHCPRIFNPIIGGGILSLKGNNYRLLVMERIDGKDFFSIGKLPNEKELCLIAKELAKLNSIDFNPPFIYDHWAIVNFIKEYNENISLVDEEDRPLIDMAYQAFKACNLKKLKYGFVHGDIIETNVLKDKQGQIHFIDFSVSNYLPRIVDLAVTICDLCLDLENVKKSKQRAEKFLNAYQETSPLSEYEKDCLRIFIICHQAITILETTREKKIENNDSKENSQFLYKGKEGLKIVIKELNNLKEIDMNFNKEV